MPLISFPEEIIGYSTVQTKCETELRVPRLAKQLQLHLLETYIITHNVASDISCLKLLSKQNLLVEMNASLLFSTDHNVFFVVFSCVFSSINIQVSRLSRSTMSCKDTNVIMYTSLCFIVQAQPMTEAAASFQYEGTQSFHLGVH